MKHQEKIKLLKAVDFIALVPESTLEDLVRNCREITVQKDEVLFEDGQPGNSMYIVLSGKLVIYKQNKVIVERVAGEYFGEMALIESKPRSASVKTLETSVLLEITKEQFSAYFSSNPQSLLALLKTLSGRSRDDLAILDKGYERLRNEENLSDRLRRILDDTSNEIFVFAPSTTHLVQINSRAKINLGITDEEASKLKFLDVVKDLTPEKFKNLVEPLRSGKKTLVVFEGINQRKDGSEYPVEIRLQFSQSEEVDLCVAIVEDNTERKAMEDRIKQMAFYDSLTGLPNRNLLKDRLAVSLNRASRNEEMIAVLLLDIDNFKSINDTMGHHTGDVLLQQVARRLTESLRKEDTVARMGGDEFVILLSNIQSPEDISRLTKKILEKLKPEFIIDAREIQISFSIGISKYPQDGKEAQTLIKKADTAMYQAKESGKNAYRLYTPSMVFQATWQMKLESELQTALDRGQMKLFFQPKVETHEGHISGLEALLRWQHPEKGLLMPSDFIFAVEESKLDVPLGEWTLMAATRQIRNWEIMGCLPPTVTINISGKYFRHDNLVSYVKKLIRDSSLTPGNLGLEIRESILMENTGEAVSRLKELNKIGLWLSIDNFGTGYSSLSHLKNMPIHALQIDQSFVDDVENPANAAIIRAIVSLAKTLQLKTIAKGVETLEQKKFLTSIGCTYLQGNLIGKPSAPEEIAGLLLKNDIPAT